MNKSFLKLLFLLFFSNCLSLSCNREIPVYLIVDNRASKTEKILAEQLKNDLHLFRGINVTILETQSRLPDEGIFYVVGTVSSNSLISEMVKKKNIVLSESFPGARGGIWARSRLSNGKEAIILAGSNVQGTQYVVYDYVKNILGIDPLRYWTGTIPSSEKKFAPYEFGNKVIAPPVVPLLCYFENDVDELANLKKPLLEYDWESYTEMINALVRLKYNAVHLFDMLGRPEFFKRDEYKKIRPDYHVRLSYIDSLINYAHDLGMKVQIDLSLGYEFKPMEQDKADCWCRNKEEWISFWKYYFEKTPIAKADIFSLRPRNQVWDWEYKSSCNEVKSQVFNEVYKVLGQFIEAKKPGATKITTCYSDGMDIFNSDFTPPNDWIIAWSDDGWGGFYKLPEKTKGYKFGTYMHAGFWKNHTVHDPYPEKIDTVMKMISKRFQATYYWEVNGQQFRPFLLNIEAFSALAKNPESFNGEDFYREWTERYFGKKAAIYAVRSMKKLHEAQFDKTGYVQHLSEIREVIGYLGDKPVERPGKFPANFDYFRVEKNFAHVNQRYEMLLRAKSDAEKGQQFISSSNTFYYDYIILPVNIYLDLLTFEKVLNEMALLKKEFENTGERNKLEKSLKYLPLARKNLEIVYQRSIEGDRNKKWNGWYNPANRRPNNGFPSKEMLNDIELNLKSKL